MNPLAIIFKLNLRVTLIGVRPSHGSPDSSLIFINSEESIKDEETLSKSVPKKDMQQLIYKLRHKSFRDILRSIKYRLTHIDNYNYVLRAYHFFLKLPIDKNLIIFASEKDYCDNSWALYQYIKNNCSKKYYFVWATLEDKKYNDDIRTKFVLHQYHFTFKSAWYIARAKYVCYTHGLGADIKKREGQTILNLWHGIPFKGLKGGFKPSSIESPLFDYAVYLGPENKRTLAQFLSCDEKFMVLLGSPRNDLMLNNKGYGYNNPFVPNDFKGKVIIWMPTFRKSINPALSEDCETSTGLPLLNTVEDINDLNAFLQSQNVSIIVKIHHLQAEEPTFKLHFSNIIFVTDDDIASKGLQLYQMLGLTDALLSDYSSIAIDYLLMDRPMGFILYDLKEYEASRGKFLYKDIRDVLAGDYIYNIEDLHHFVAEVAHGVDSTKEKREELIPKMITYPDNRSCERICKFLNID
jgi:CDP-glycerol glycerophosphotransferase